MFNRAMRTAALNLMLALTACGSAVPEIKEVWDSDYPGLNTDPNVKGPKIPPLDGSAQIEFEVKKRIWCDLRDAIQASSQYTVETVGSTSKHTDGWIPDDWGAQVSLMLQVDESSALTPQVSFSTPILPSGYKFPNGVALPGSQATQSYSTGIGATVSSTATRIDKFDSYYTVQSLREPYNEKSACLHNHPENDILVQIMHTPAKSSPLIVSDLGITNWFLGAMFSNDFLPSHKAPKKVFTSAELNKLRRDLTAEGFYPNEITQIVAARGSSGSPGGSDKSPDTISIEIKFILVSTGTVNPSWHMVPISNNTGTTPLFSTGRTRTHDVIITIGPSNSDTANTHLASQINSVSRPVGTLTP